MRADHLWNRAKNASIRTSAGVKGNFDIGFAEKIPAETRDALERFVVWVEANFSLPITLWVDFEYKHYLVSRSGKRVGYLFGWDDFAVYPVFDNSDGIPSIRLPVRTEHSTMEEILTSFIEAITCYFAWITNGMTEGYIPDADDVEEVLQEYLRDCAN